MSLLFINGHCAHLLLHIFLYPLVYLNFLMSERGRERDRDREREKERDQSTTLEHRMGRIELGTLDM